MSNSKDLVNVTCVVGADPPASQPPQTEENRTAAVGNRRPLCSLLIGCERGPIQRKEERGIIRHVVMATSGPMAISRAQTTAPRVLGYKERGGGCLGAGGRDHKAARETSCRRSSCPLLVIELKRSLPGQSSDSLSQTASPLDADPSSQAPNRLCG